MVEKIVGKEYLCNFVFVITIAHIKQPELAEILIFRPLHALNLHVVFGVLGVLVVIAMCFGFIFRIILNAAKLTIHPSNSVLQTTRFLANTSRRKSAQVRQNIESGLEGKIPLYQLWQCPMPRIRLLILSVSSLCLFWFANMHSDRWSTVQQA